MSHVMVFGTRRCEMNAKQRKALDEIANFILWYTSDEVERERMHEAACDYVEQDHVLAEQEEAA